MVRLFIVTDPRLRINFIRINTIGSQTFFASFHRFACVGSDNTTHMDGNFTFWGYEWWCTLGVVDTIHTMRNANRRSLPDVWWGVVFDVWGAHYRLWCKYKAKKYIGKTFWSSLIICTGQDQWTAIKSSSVFWQRNQSFQQILYLAHLKGELRVGMYMPKTRSYRKPWSRSTSESWSWSIDGPSTKACVSGQQQQTTDKNNNLLLFGYYNSYINK